MDSEHNIPKRNAEESLSVVLKTEVVSWRNTSLFGEKTKQNKIYIYKNRFKGDVFKKKYKKKIQCLLQEYLANHYFISSLQPIAKRIIYFQQPRAISQ